MVFLALTPEDFEILARVMDSVTDERYMEAASADARIMAAVGRVDFNVGEPIASEKVAREFLVERSVPAPAPRKIVVRYSAIDRYRKNYRYSTLEGAAKRVRELLGDYFDIGSSYAVSGDGVGKVTLEGATFAELGFEG